jgi:hypothetical protein
MHIHLYPSAPCREYLRGLLPENENKAINQVHLPNLVLVVQWSKRIYMSDVTSMNHVGAQKGPPHLQTYVVPRPNIGCMRR